MVEFYCLMFYCRIEYWKRNNRGKLELHTEPVDGRAVLEDLSKGGSRVLLLCRYILIEYSDWGLFCRHLYSRVSFRLTTVMLILKIFLQVGNLCLERKIIKPLEMIRKKNLRFVNPCHEHLYQNLSIND